VEPVVEGAREAEGELPLARRDGRGEDEPRALRRLVEGDGAVDGHAAVAGEGGAVNGKLGGVAHDLCHRRLHLDGDHRLAHERGGDQVGLEPEIVARRHDGSGKPVVHGGR
jgi:hypothetical protein